MAILVRAERAADHAAVERIHELAFGQPNEARLVAALRRAASPQISLVAEDDGRPVGHVFFSPVTLGGEGGVRNAIALAPVGVLPERQNEEIGSELVRAGLEACRALGEPLVFVLGHVAYYPRFGFEPASKYGISSEYGSGPSFMVQALEPGALEGCAGLVRYHPEFAKAGS